MPYDYTGFAILLIIAAILFVIGLYFASNAHIVLRATTARQKRGKAEVFGWIPFAANIPTYINIKNVIYRATHWRQIKGEFGGTLTEVRYMLTSTIPRIQKLYANRWFWDNTDNRQMYGARQTMVVIGEEHGDVRDQVITDMRAKMGRLYERETGMKSELEGAMLSESARNARKKMEERVSEHLTLGGYTEGTMEDTGLPMGASK